MWSCRLSIHISYDSDSCGYRRETPTLEPRRWYQNVHSNPTYDNNNNGNNPNAHCQENRQIICALEIYEAVKNELITTTYKNLEES